jgi:hypothetical protein
MNDAVRSAVREMAADSESGRSMNIDVLVAGEARVMSTRTGQVHARAERL